jgi:hypothetical protein
LDDTILSVPALARQIVTLLNRYELPTSSLPWLSGTFNESLEILTAQELCAWCTRTERKQYPRFFCFYSPEWFADHLRGAEDALREASQTRIDYLELESQALILAIQYTLEVVQRPYAFASMRLQTEQASKIIGSSKEDTRKSLASVDEHEKILAAHYEMRQALHGIHGGALNFSERLDDLREKYLLQMKELTDRSEAAHHGLRTSMLLEIKPPPGQAVFNGDDNPISQYRAWLADVRRKLNACAFSETQFTFVFSLKTLFPDLQERLRTLTPAAKLELEFEIPFPTLGAESPAGVMGIYPIAISPLPLVPDADIGKENAWLFAVRTDSKAVERGRMLRSAFDVTITPPIQADSEEEENIWQPSVRRFENVPFAGDRTLGSTVDRSGAQAFSRLRSDGRFTIALFGSARVGTDVSVANALSPKADSDAKLIDIALVVDAIYRSTTVAVP